MELDPVARDAARGLDAAGAEILLGRRSGAFVSAGLWSDDEIDTPDPGCSLSTPLRLGGEVVGTLDIRRSGLGAWPQSDLGTLARSARGAAAAARTAALARRRRRQLAGIERSLVSVRRQNHEHANRLHTLGALTAMGEEDEVRHFLAELLEGGEGLPQARSHGIEDAFLTGLLAGEAEAARSEGVGLEIDPGSRLSRLPPVLPDTGWAVLLGSLLEFAFEGAAGVRVDRRRVTFGAWSDGRGVTLSARDPGPRCVPHALCTALLREAAGAARGTLAIETRPEGTLATVRVPA